MSLITKTALAPYLLIAGMASLAGGGVFLWHKGNLHGQTKGKALMAEQVEKQYHDELVAITAERDLSRQINLELQGRLAKLPTSAPVKEAVRANPSSCPVAPAVSRSLRDQAASANAARAAH